MGVVSLIWDSIVMNLRSGIDKLGRICYGKIRSNILQLGVAVLSSLEL